MFLSLGNEAGMRELLAVGEVADNKTLPSGKTKWRDVFNQTVQIRRWGIEEALRETGMLDRWQDLLNPINPTQAIHFQIELFYRRSEDRRRQSERDVAALLEAAGGRTLGNFIDMPEIAFHAVKAELPAERVQQLLNDLNPRATTPTFSSSNFMASCISAPPGKALQSRKMVKVSIRK